MSPHHLIPLHYALRMNLYLYLNCKRIAFNICFLSCDAFNRLCHWFINQCKSDHLHCSIRYSQGNIRHFQSIQLKFLLTVFFFQFFHGNSARFTVGQINLKSVFLRGVWVFMVVVWFSSLYYWIFIIFNVTPDEFTVWFALEVDANAVTEWIRSGANKRYSESWSRNGWKYKRSVNRVTEAMLWRDHVNQRSEARSNQEYMWKTKDW